MTNKKATVTNVVSIFVSAFLLVSMKNSPENDVYLG